MGKDNDESLDEESPGENIDTLESEATSFDDRLEGDMTLDDLPDSTSLDNIGLAAGLVDPDIPPWLRNIDSYVGTGIDATPVWDEVNLPPWVGGIDLPPWLESAIARSTLDKPAWTDIDVPPVVQGIDDSELTGLKTAARLVDASLTHPEFNDLSKSLWWHDVEIPVGFGDIDIPRSIAGLTTTGIDSPAAPPTFEVADVSTEVDSLSRGGYASDSVTPSPTRASPSGDAGISSLESEIEAYLRRVRARISFERTYSALEVHGSKIDRGILLFIAGQLLKTASGPIAGPAGFALSALGSALAIFAYLNSNGSEKAE